MVSAPTHLVAEPGASKALCGVKDPLPRVWARWAQAHIDGHGMPVCPACDAIWRPGQQQGAPS